MKRLTKVIIGISYVLFISLTLFLLLDVETKHKEIVKLKLDLFEQNLKMDEIQKSNEDLERNVSQEMKGKEFYSKLLFSLDDMFASLKSGIIEYDKLITGSCQYDTRTDFLYDYGRITNKINAVMEKYQDLLNALDA